MECFSVETPDTLEVITMSQLDALALAGQCLLGVLGFMALIGLALLLVNWIGRRRGEKTDAPAPRTPGTRAKLPDTKP